MNELSRSAVDQPTRVTGVLLGLVTICAALPIPLRPTAARAQLRGTVADDGGRVLPLAVVVSRTRNGFLGTLTDARGRFAFAGRPHAAGDRIEVKALGFRPKTIRLRGDETVLGVTLQPDSVSPTFGWTVGLATDFDIDVVGPDGVSVAKGDSVTTGRPYRMTVTVRGQPDCIHVGPTPVLVEPDRVTVAVGIYERRGACAARTTNLIESIEHVFDHPGPIQLRLVGRWREEAVSLVAVPSNEPGRASRQ